MQASVAEEYLFLVLGEHEAGKFLQIGMNRQHPATETTTSH
jgi:hypothetical protein